MGQKALSLAFIAVAFVGVGAANFPYRDPAGAKETLQKATALKDIKISDSRDWISSCSKGDLFRTKFSGINDKGQQVDGVVCKGIFKGTTIRYD